MKLTGILIIVIGMMAGLYNPAIAHTVNYQVENKGISARIFYSPDDPASYSQYEIFGPGDKIPHRDKNPQERFRLVPAR